MKKTIFAVVAIMALLLPSCKKDVKDIDLNTLDNTTNKCWEYTYEVKAKGISATITNYIWGTERECVAVLQLAAKGANGAASYKEVAGKDADACYELIKKASQD